MKTVIINKEQKNLIEVSKVSTDKFYLLKRNGDDDLAFIHDKGWDNNNFVATSFRDFTRGNNYGCDHHNLIDFITWATNIGMTVYEFDTMKEMLYFALEQLNEKN